MLSRKSIVIAMGGMVLVSFLGLAVAQQEPPTTPPSENQISRRDPKEFRAQMEKHMKEMMGVTDEEWQAIQPRLEKVLKASRQIQGGMFARHGRAGAGQEESPVAKAAQEMRKALENKDTSADVIKEKLAALRAAKEKAKAALVAAQKELRELLTQRQEAVLVSVGLLD